MVPVQRILYPTDFSSFSNQAYLHAVALAETYRAHLTILYVVPRDTFDRDYWRNQLEQIRPANPAIAVSHVLLDGDPAREIPRYAAEAGIDLVVMGTHGRSGHEYQLMGSVAEQTLRDAPCSVLVVKLNRGQPKADEPDRVIG